MSKDKQQALLAHIVICRVFGPSTANPETVVAFAMPFSDFKTRIDTAVKALPGADPNEVAFAAVFPEAVRRAVVAATLSPALAKNPNGETSSYIAQGARTGGGMGFSFDEPFVFAGNSLCDSVVSSFLGKGKTAAVAKRISLIMKGHLSKYSDRCFDVSEAVNTEMSLEEMSKACLAFMEGAVMSDDKKPRPAAKAPTKSV